MTKSEYAKILWRCRRGARELDSLLMPFAEGRYPGMSAVEQSCLCRLLTQQDPQILDWVLGRTTPVQADMRRLVKAIIEFSSTKRLT